MGSMTIDERLKPYTKSASERIGGVEVDMDGWYEWIVPIKGELSWEGCSSGEIIGIAREVDRNGRIGWDARSLELFWKDMIRMGRKGRVGGIGIKVDKLFGIECFTIKVSGNGSMYVRNVLDAWYGFDRIRLLKKARLVLLHDRSLPIIVS